MPGKPIARENDQVVGLDTHIVMVPAGPALIPTPLPHPHTGVLDANLSTNVKANGRPVATVGREIEFSSSRIS
jgi:uncharacterized Zn-binding protein involved in type VI secretion